MRNDNAKISDLMARCRAAQKKSGRKISGRFSLKDTAILAQFVAAARQACTAEKDLCKRGLSVPIAIRLVERFEKMCRQQNLTLQQKERVSITRCLLGELGKNMAVLEPSTEIWSLRKAEKYVTFTVLHGAAAQRLWKLFPELHSQPGALKRSVKSYADPEKKIRQRIKAVERLVAGSKEKENEFHCFQKTPGIFMHAVFYHANPEVWMRQVKKGEVLYGTPHQRRKKRASRQKSRPSIHKPGP